MGIAGALGGVPLVSFEERRPATLARMFSRHGATVVPPAAPRASGARDLPAPPTPEALALVRRLRDARFGAIVLPNAAGARALTASVADAAPDFPTLLQRTALITANAATTTALLEIGLLRAHMVPPPGTWRETLGVLDALGLPEGAPVAVVEYGDEPGALMLGLAARGHDVLRVPVWRWTLPADVEPLRERIEAICTGGARIAVFTGPMQVEHLFRVAPDRDALRAALGRMVVVTSGVACSELLAAYGVRPTLEADSPRMKPLVHLVADRAPALLRIP